MCLLLQSPAASVCTSRHSSLRALPACPNWDLIFCVQKWSWMGVCSLHLLIQSPGSSVPSGCFLSSARGTGRPRALALVVLSPCSVLLTCSSHLNKENQFLLWLCDRSCGVAVLHRVGSWYTCSLDQPLPVTRSLGRFIHTS